MDNQIIIIALFSVIVILLLLIVFGLVAYVFFFNQKESAPSQPQITQPLDKETLKELMSQSVKGEKKIVALCNVCERELEEQDHFEIDKLHFCKEHYNVYIKNEWTEISNQRTTADTPEAGIYIYNFQKNLWGTERIPSFIVCEYKIDINTDQIETYVKLNVIDKMATQLEERLKQSRVVQ